MINRITRSFLRSILRMSMYRLQRGPHITRYYFYQHFAEFSSRLGEVSKCLAISGSTNLTNVMGIPQESVMEANFPEFNWTSLPFANESFDMVVSNQVLEHVQGGPQAAINESFRVLMPNGLLVVASVFSYKIHLHPADLWRFSPEGLTELCRVAGFRRVIECGGWGNQYVWLLNWLGLLYEGVPHAKWHPLHRLACMNDPAWPIVVWAVVQK